MVMSWVKTPVWGLVLLLFLSTTVLPATNCGAVHLPQAGSMHSALVHVAVPCDTIQARGDTSSSRVVCGLSFFLIPALVSIPAALDIRAQAQPPALPLAPHARLQFDPPPRSL